MGRPKKPPGTAVDKRNGNQIDFVIPASATRFDLPDGIRLTKPGWDAWNAYWDDDISKIHTPSDKDVLIRWVTNLDRYYRLVEEADKQPVVRGSQGQPVENPLYKVAFQALVTAEKCEQQMGIGALNRSRLGITVATMFSAKKKTIDQLNQGYGGGVDVSHRPDPRVINAT